MRRSYPVLVLSLVIVMSTAAVGAAEDPTYGWSLSASSTDPTATEGIFLPGARTLFLWFACGDAGASAAEFELVSPHPGNVVLAVNQRTGFIIQWIAPNLLITMPGCPTAPVVAADVLILANAPGRYCLGPTAAGILGTYDCEPAPGLWPHQWIGYAEDGTPPCSDQWLECQGNVPVEGESWGRLKSLYK